jgi:chromate transporter
LGGVRPTWRRAAAVTLICLGLWSASLVALALALGTASVYYQEGIFFSKAALVTFGGAYSVLAYVAQQAVERYQWLRAGEMLDGLGMAETTPGPLIQVVQFVAFMGAYRDPGPFHPLVAGLLGSLVATWVTFVPCFLWIFLGAPYIERLRGHRLLTAALSTITAAVVGVVLNLAVWFALHVLFGSVDTFHFAGLRWLVPDVGTLDILAATVAGLALLLTFVFRKPMGMTLAVCASVGAVLYLLAR